MRGPGCQGSLVTILVVALVVLAGNPPHAFAVPGEEEESARVQAQAQQAPDFFFARPRTSVGLRGDWVFARARSDIFDFFRDQFTLDKSAFNGFALGADLGIALSSRVEAVAGFEVGRASPASEYRRFVDDNDLPIRQTTRLSEMNLSGGVKIALAPRGRQVSSLVWVPRRVVPYVGAGAGLLRYQLKQDGDFVDFVDSSIFADTFTSSGWTPSVHVLGGVDLKVRKRVSVSLEARYLWANAGLGRDFVDFEPIDLTGLRAGAGINVLF